MHRVLERQGRGRALGHSKDVLSKMRLSGRRQEVSGFVGAIVRFLRIARVDPILRSGPFVLLIPQPFLIPQHARADPEPLPS